jgi:hypothetical protein
MSKPKILLSHVEEENELARLIKDDLIDKHLLEVVDVFVSSDSTTVKKCTKPGLTSTSGCAVIREQSGKAGAGLVNAWRQGRI